MESDRRVNDLTELLRRYVRQETVDPLRSVGRFVGLGIIGGVLIAIGAVEIAIAGLRLLQKSDLLDGHWSWVPYLLAAVGLLTTAFLLMSRIRSEDGDARPVRR